MAYDFLNPFFDGKIWCAATGEEIGFALKTTPEPGVVGGNGLYVSSAEIVLGLKENLELSLTLTPTYLEALLLIDESQYFRLGNTVYLRWGYNDGLGGHISDWYIGFMQMPELSMGEEISITLKATGFAFNLNRIVTSRVWSDAENPKTFEYVASEISKKYGLKLSFDKSINMENGVAFELLRHKPRTDLNQGGMTDLMFLSEKAREVGAQMIIRNEFMIFSLIEQPEDANKQVSHEFHMYGKIDTENNIFPMLGFSPESFGVLFLPHKQGYMSWIQGPNDDPAVEPVPVESNNIKKQNIGQDNFFSGEEDLNTPDVIEFFNEIKMKISVVPDKQHMETGKCIPIAASNEFYKENAASILDSVRQDKAGDLGIMVNFESLALPTLLPGMLVRLRGISSYFSCDYMARKVTINLDSSGGNMSVQAGMKGFPAGLELLAEEINKYKEATSTSSSEENVEPDSDAAE